MATATASDTGAAKILFVVNEASFFLSHRLPLAQEARELGLRVTLICGEGTGEERLPHGIVCRTLTLSRSGWNPFAEARTVMQMARLYREEAPDLVHHVTIKPVIYGTLLARVLGVPAVVNAIPGLGHVFARHGGWAGLRRAIVSRLYRLSLAHPNSRIIVQNREDYDALRDQVGVGPEELSLLRGSGVDLQEFAYQPEPEGPPVFVFIARMLEEKGVREFVAAAERVRTELPESRFLLVGDTDSGNPSSLSPQELAEWDERGFVRWLGHRDDVAAILRRCHVACLPTYYREGLPKSLIEAAAIGRAIIAADVPGCREAIRDGVTGLLVPPRDAASLAAAMTRLGRDGELRRQLGLAARRRAEILFSIEDVVHDTFLIYRELLAP